MTSGSGVDDIRWNGPEWILSTFCLTLARIVERRAWQILKLKLLIKLVLSEALNMYGHSGELTICKMDRQSSKKLSLLL
jgi:hypothetical protein